MKKLSLIVIAFFPAVALAAPLSSFKDFIYFVTSSIINPLIYLLFALAVVVFLWGVLTYIKNGDDATKRAEGQKFMLYGIIGLFVFVAFWGLVGILADSFQVRLDFPAAPTPSAPR